MDGGSRLNKASIAFMVAEYRAAVLAEDKVTALQVAAEFASQDMGMMYQELRPVDKHGYLDEIRALGLEEALDKLRDSLYDRSAVRSDKPPGPGR